MGTTAHPSSSHYPHLQTLECLDYRYHTLYGYCTIMMANLLQVPETDLLGA